MEPKSPATYPHGHLTERIIGAFFDVYNELRAGLRENVYERAMVLALRDQGISIEQQVGMTVRFGGRPVGTFRADLIVAKTLNALRATGLQVGLILNFGPKAPIKRLVFSRKDEAPVQ